MVTRNPISRHGKSRHLSLTILIIQAEDLMSQLGVCRETLGNVCAPLLEE